MTVRLEQNPYKNTFSFGADTHQSIVIHSYSVKETVA